MNIIERAIAAAAVSLQSQALLHDEARSTLPMLTASADGQAIIVGYHTAESKPSPNTPRKINFPFLEARIDLPTLKVSAHRIEPRDYGLEIKPDEYVGDLGDILKIDFKKFKSKRQEYNDLLSLVADRKWLLGVSMPENDEVETAIKLCGVLSDIGERALAPYYNRSGAVLFQWMATMGARHCI